MDDDLKPEFWLQTSSSSFGVPPDELTGVYRHIPEWYACLVPDSNPRVDIIVPVYNGFDLLEESIRSIEFQTFRDFRIIVIDDGSTDGTSERLEAISNSRVQIQHLNTPGGPGAARNAGLELATAEFVAFCDADDLWLPEKLESQIRALESNPELVLLGTRVRTFTDASGHREHLEEWLFETDDARIREYAVYNCSYATPAVVIRRSILTEHKLRFRTDIGKAAGEDFDFWTRISEYGQVQNLPEIFTLCRQHPSQTTRRTDYNMRDFPTEVRSRALSTLGLQATQHELLLVARIGRYESLDLQNLIEASILVRRFVRERKAAGVDPSVLGVHYEMLFQAVMRPEGSVASKAVRYLTMIRYFPRSIGMILNELNRLIRK